MGKIILFYKYVDVEHPESMVKWQKKLCSLLELTGRIIIATEGINGTLAGSNDAIQQYQSYMEAHELFGGIDYKTSLGDASTFPRLCVLKKNEIVYLGIPAKQLSAKDGGKHVNPQQAHELLNQKTDDLVILDCRNRYETIIGAVSGAVCPPTQYFREFPTYIDNNAQQFEGKQVLMYCTGGIRCERASAYVKQHTKAKEVLQIEGGIHRYVEQFPDGHFRGKNYVFDGRVAVRINDDVLATCYVCQAACDEYTNCVRADCNRHFICCYLCKQKLGNTCGRECKAAIEDGISKRRPDFAQFTR